MIPIFKANGDRNPINVDPAYGSASDELMLNNPLDDPDDTYLVEDVDIVPTLFLDIDPSPDRDGMSVHEPRRIQLLITIRGWVKARTSAALYDKIRLLNATFDPVMNHVRSVLAQGEATASWATDNGFTTLEFDIPTANTTDYPTGIISARYAAAPVSVPVPLTTKFDGHSARFVIRLRCNDPVMYSQTLSADDRTGNGNVTADNLLGTYYTYPTVNLIMGGTSGSGSPTITIGSTVLTLVGTQLVSGNTYAIDYRHRRAWHSDGTEYPTLVVAGSTWGRIEAADSETVAFASFPANATLGVTFRVAYAS